MNAKIVKSDKNFQALETVFDTAWCLAMHYLPLRPLLVFPNGSKANRGELLLCPLCRQCNSLLLSSDINSIHLLSELHNASATSIIHCQIKTLATCRVPQDLVTFHDINFFFPLHCSSHDKGADWMLQNQRKKSFPASTSFVMNSEP